MEANGSLDMLQQQLSVPGECAEPFCPKGAPMRSRSHARALLLSSMALLLVSSTASLADGRPTRHWANAGARANGLDLDDDFVVGEKGVDDRLCDPRGGNDSSAGYLEDFDGDGVVEQQWFVVGSSPPPGLTRGRDSATCGSLSSPCATISRAWTNAEADGGPGNGEDVVCLAGTVRESLRMPVSGRSGKKTKRPAGGTNEQWSFTYPRDPAMLVGVDADDDGVYPPVDGQDRAILQAASSGEDTTWAYTAQGGLANLEVAHVTFLDWGRHTKEGGGLMRFRRNTGVLDGFYLHDFRAQDINKDQCVASDTILFSSFASRVAHLAVEYGDLVEVAGYVSRGGFEEPYARFRGLDIDLIGLGGNGNSNVAGQTCGNQSGDSVTLMRIWGLDRRDNHIEWIDNDIELLRWQKGSPGRSAAGILLCGIRKFHYVGNRVANFVGGLPLLDTKDNICRNHDPHFAGDYLFARNTVVVNDPSRLRSDRFVNTVGWIDTNTGTNRQVSGASGYYIVEHNEVDYSRLGDNDRLSTFFVMQNARDADYRGLQVRVSNNDIVGRFARNAGALLWANDAGDTGTPNEIVLDNNTLHDPHGGSVLSMLSAAGGRHVDRVSGAGNGFADCRWDWDGRRQSSPGELDSASGLRSSNCNNARPTLGNSSGGGGGGSGGGGGGGGAASSRLRFLSTEYDVQESAGFAEIAVERTGDLAGEVMVDYEAQTRSARASDFVPDTGTLTFADGEAVQTFRVVVLDDFEQEGDERVRLVLSNPVGATLAARDQANLTIRDDDFASAVQFVSPSTVVREGDGAARVAIERVGGLGSTVTATVSVRGLGARTGSDYVLGATTVQWQAGEAGVRELEVVVLDDGVAEPMEIVRLEITPGPSHVVGERSVAAVLVEDDDGPASCSAGGDRLCLGGGRFSVEALWLDTASDTSGRGVPDPESDQTGLFWFFDEDNIELLVKVLDGRALTGSHWLFYGALSDIEYYVAARDELLGTVRLYRNPPGSLAGVGDVDAFPEEGARPSGGPAAPRAQVVGLGSGAPSLQEPSAAAAECAALETALCLQGGRFLVEVEWSTRTSEGGQVVERVGDGVAVPRTDASGLFWFFEESNLELVVKVLDGRAINGRFWVFWGALTDVAYTLVVTDTETGATRRYERPAGAVVGGSDVDAFEG